MRRTLILAVTVAALVVPGPADADVYCAYSTVNDCPAGSISDTNLQTVLTAAAGTIVRDTVLIRPGFYDASANAGFDYISSSPVDVVGAGAVGSSSPSMLGDTSSPSPGQTTLRVTGNSTSTITGIHVFPASANNAIGLFTDATAHDISAETAGSGTAMVAVHLDPGGVLAHSHVVSDQANGAAVTAAGQTRIEDSGLVGQYGVQTTAAANLVVRRTRIEAYVIGRFPLGGDFEIEDVVGVTSQSTQVTSHGLLFFSSGAIVNARINHVTLIGNGEPTSLGLELIAVDADASVTVRNSILRGWASQVERDGAAGHPANVTVAYSDVPAPIEAPSSTGPGTTTSTANVDIDPLFAAPAQGDFELSAGSPLIDAGDPAGLSSGEGAADARGAPRVVDALGNCAARTDMGAYERSAGPRAPRAAANAAPAAVLTGQAAAFDASASCDPDGDALTYAWRFDDGASASGPTATHAFIMPGPHHGVVTVSDASGRTATASAEVVVAAPFAGAKVTGGKVKLNKRGRAPVQLSCPVAAAGICDGTLTLLGSGKGVGSKTFSIVAGKSARVAVKPRVKVPRRGLKVTASAVSHDGSGQSATRTAKLTLRR